MSIYSQIKTLLESDAILQVYLKSTETNKKVFFHYPQSSIEENVPCITYYFVETPRDYKDPLTTKDGILYIDIWSKNNLNDVYDRVLYLLTTLSFYNGLSQSIDLFENDTQIYDKHLQIDVIGG